LYDVSIDLGNKQVSAKADLLYPSNWSVKSGVSENPHLTNIDVLLMIGQLAQLMLYSGDKITRDQSKNMWVRSVNLFNAKRFEKLDNVPLVLKEVETYYPKINGKYWHIGVMKGSIGDGAIKISNYKVCYELPEHLQLQYQNDNFSSNETDITNSAEGMTDEH